MIPRTLGHIANVVGGAVPDRGAAAAVERVCVDSRGASPGSLFFALPGQHADGHDFLPDAFANGATAAVISAEKAKQLKLDPDWNLVVVPSPLRALQDLAKSYRREAFGKVVAITGSNGKTITKDALGALLAGRRVFVSPGSYNGQLGLPLAILSAERREELAILEVGISEPGEMDLLQEIAAPDCGILVNVGVAHFAAFGSREAIAREKMKLFADIGADGWVLLPMSEPLIAAPAARLACEVFEVGQGGEQPIALKTLSLAEDGQLVELRDPLGRTARARIRTSSTELIADLRFAAAAAYKLGVPVGDIALGLNDYVPPRTRMETWLSPEGIRIINDAYSSDPISVGAALKHATALAGPSGRKIFAFGGMRELGTIASQEHRQVGILAAECGFDPVFLVGDGHLARTADGYRSVRPRGTVVTVAAPEKLNGVLLPTLLPGDTVLLKGPRNTGMVQAAQGLSGSIAQRCMWVDIAAIKGNLDRFRRHCGGRVKILAMLKALAYGTHLTARGADPAARDTDFTALISSMTSLGIQQVGVSSTNEGMAVRKTGADQEVLVFLPSPADVDNLLRYRLTPVIFSSERADSFVAALAARDEVLDVHLKIDTGMHRVGVDPDEVLPVARKIRDCRQMNLAGVCTHFACAEDPDADDFTRRQIAVFDAALEALRRDGFQNLQVHASNTAAAARFAQARYDMVRIGIGLYGVYPSEAVRAALPDLELAVGVTSRIASIRTYPPGETLGYGRAHRVETHQKVGVISFGYGDGLPLSLSGIGHVLVEGQVAPILGRISMDQAQVDITGIEGVHVGAEVLLLGAHGGHSLRPEKVAEDAGTIAHELLVSIGQRVHRIYVEQ
jgi:alanine racemase